MNQPLLPTKNNQRIITLDIIRGFALLGILLVNMAFFNSPKLFLSSSEIVMFEGPTNILANYFIAIFATGNFFTMFSILFGLGFFIFMERVEAKELAITKVYSKRLLFLLGLGLFHVIFLWSGDILLPYAIAGFFLLLFRNLSLEAVRKWAIGLFVTVNLVIFALTTLSVISMELFGEEFQESYFGEIIGKSLSVYQNGSFGEILSFRLAEEVPLVFWNLIIVVPFVLSIFLLGLYLGKKGVLRNINEHLEWVKAVWLRSLVFGMIFTALFLLLKTNMITIPFYLHHGLLEVVGYVKGLSFCFLYMTSIVLLCQSPYWKKRLSFLAPVGRMALTNYILQTVICIFIYNGFGLGFYGEITPEDGIVVTFIIFTFQVFVSKYWFTYFQFGPLEWLWRAFTYSYIPKMKLQEK